MTNDPLAARRRQQRTRLSFVGLGLGLVIVALLLALLTQRTSTATAPSRATGPGSQFDGPTFPVGLRAAPFSLKDQDGKPASLVQYRGGVIVLSFLYSHCRDTCPLMATEIRGALDTLPGNGRNVPVLAITVDPAHDSAASARAFITRERMTGRMRFLLGSYREIEPIYKRYGIQPEFDSTGQEYSHGHSSFVILIDRRGYERVGFPAGQLVPEDLAHDIKVLLRSRA
jgi:protein SCO1